MIPATARATLAAVVTVLGLVILGLASPGLGGFGVTAPPGPSASPGGSPGPLAAGHGAAPLLTTFSAPRALESGRGTFFTNVPVPNGTGSYSSCVSILSFGGTSRECFNATVDPTLNLTSTGTTALAYTTFTDDAPCAAMRANATTEVGFTTSTTFGSTWSRPTYLGNPICASGGSEDRNYSNAMEPTLTSLANGTLVLAYVEYNITNVTSYYQTVVVPYSIGCEYTVHNRIVVSESYTGGSSWTTPTVLAETDTNSTLSSSCSIPGIPLLRPSIAATGDTVYLAWMSDPYPFDQCCLRHANYTGTLALAVSTDGGATWTNGSVPPTIVLGAKSPFSEIAAYPDLLVAPSGELFLSYATGFDSQFQCTTKFCGTIYNASLVVGRSSNNGTTFLFSVVTNSAGTMPPYDYFSMYLSDPLSQMAYDPAHNHLFVAYSSAQVGQYCEFNPGAPPYCGSQGQPDDLFVSGSTNGGRTFSTPVRVASSLSGSRDSPYNFLTLGSIAVGSNSTVQVAFSLDNDSQCDPFQCDAAQEVYVNSTDGGVQWSEPALVDQNFSYIGTCPGCNSEWMGTSSATLAAGDQLLIAWPQLYDPNGSYSSWGYGPGAVSIETSRLFTGTGITVVFNETGLPSGAGWNVSVGGFLRTGPAGTNLSISGVPPAFNLSYTGPWSNVSTGVAYAPTFIPASPGSFTVNSTVSVTYAEHIEVTISTVPFVSTSSYYWSQYTNVIPTPLPGSYWTTVGTPFSASLLPNTPSYCYPCLNLTFLSWTGSGAGSVNSTGTSLTFLPNGPVTETASFTYSGYCYPSPATCYTYNFSQSASESGLPEGTPWGITVVEANGTATYAEGTGGALTVNVTQGVASFAAWDVPSGVPGLYWLPTTGPISPAMLPTVPITVHYRLGTLNQTLVPLFARETGLPNGTSWSLQVGTLDSASSAAVSVLQVGAGAAVSVNASSVEFENGTGAFLSQVTMTPLTSNASSTTVAPGGSVALEGGAVLTFEYQPEYLVTPVAGEGGNVTPAAQWVDLGRSINLTAVPAAGSHFVDWTGSGTGSISSGTLLTITVTPHGPVTEFATFRADFAPTWNLTIQADGFGPSTPFTVLLGGVAYSGIGGMRIGNLSTGEYVLTAPVLGVNGSNTSRLVATSISATQGWDGVQLDLAANTTLTVDYQVQYSLSVFATPGGSVVGYPNGVYWAPVGPVSLTAVANPGFSFAGWSGTSSGTDPTLVIEIDGASNQTAQFLPVTLPPPAVFALTATQSGLPMGLTWALTVGTAGAAGTGTFLTLNGLNGTYALTAPPVLGTAGTRYVSDTTNATETVTSNLSITVTFTAQYLVTVAAGAGGSVSPGTEWVDAGTSISLTATPNDTSMVFDEWNGSSNSTAETLHLIVSGPISEVASFSERPGAAPMPASSPSPFIGLAIGIVLLGILLVVGALIVRGASRRPPSPPPEEWESGSSDLASGYPEATLEYPTGPEEAWGPTEPAQLPPDGSETYPYPPGDGSAP